MRKRWTRYTPAANMSIVYPFGCHPLIASLFAPANPVLEPASETAARPASAPSAFDGSRMPRYLQLATLFRRRIESGHWPLGKQVPTVDDLAAACGVARATVRQALDILAEENLIARYRAKGTFVTRQSREELWCEVKTDWSGLLMSPEGATMS